MLLLSQLALYLLQVVMTIVVAFILELFLFRIQYRRKLKLDDIDGELINLFCPILTTFLSQNDNT